ncbi:MAG: acyl carrier protein [Paracoccaceae bacterium]|nr:acyl carrier protein [Paracoccaceae bacterium]
MGDGDEIELIQDVEKAFGIEFGDAELNDLRNVGELYDIVCKKIDFDANSACLSARAFRDFRDAFPASRVRPSTPIEDLRGDRSSDQDLCRVIGDRSGFDFNLTYWGNVVSWACFLTVLVPPVLALLWAEVSGYGAAAWLLLWFALPLFRFAPAHLPAEIATAGDLVRWSMGRNYPSLRETGGVGTRADVWLALCGVARDAACYNGLINRDTTFFP